MTSVNESRYFDRQSKAIDQTFGSRAHSRNPHGEPTTTADQRDAAIENGSLGQLRSMANGRTIVIGVILALTLTLLII